MNVTTRFLTGGLASLAIASAVTLAGPSAYAEDGPARPCGEPASPAVYVTVVHDPELRLVPAVTHDEWRWQRTVTTVEHEFTKVVRPATTEYLWSRTVVDQPALPAVPGTPEQGHLETVVVTPAVTVTLFEYVQQQTGNTRWERDGWNGEVDGEDHGKGWTKSGATREDVVTAAVTEDVWVVDQPAVPGTPAVEEVSHQVTAWAASSPGDDWDGPLDSRDVPAVLDTVWATSAPEGYSPTGGSRVRDVSTEETDSTSATAPDGDGWTAIADSRVTVVDEPEHTELVGEGWTEEILVAPAVPASEPCPETGQGDAVAGAAAGPTAPDGTTGTSGTAHAAAPAAAASVLPATGSPASPWLVAAGAGAQAGGTVLVRVGRRRRTA